MKWGQGASVADPEVILYTIFRLKREETSQKSMKDFFRAAPAPTLQGASSSATSSKVEQLFDEDNLSDTIVDVSSDEEKDLRIDCDLSSPGKSRIFGFSFESGVFVLHAFSPRRRHLLFPVYCSFFPHLPPFS